MNKKIYTQIKSENIQENTSNDNNNSEESSDSSDEQQRFLLYSFHINRKDKENQAMKNHMKMIKKKLRKNRN